jgi:hypothetical protein
MGMAFLQPGCGNLDEATTLLERGNILGARISHTRAQSSDELVNDVGNWSAIGNFSFNSFGN